jgi:PIN domain nuclease of toxin-antitoxin system
MRVLLDTQIFLWATAEPARLGGMKSVLQDVSHTIHLSPASTWEIAIKHSLGTLQLPAPPAEFIPTRMSSMQISNLDITHSHTLAVTELAPHHRDPFDRLLLAQANVEEMVIATADPVFARYTDQLLMP